MKTATTHANQRIIIPGWRRKTAGMTVTSATTVLARASHQGKLRDSHLGMSSVTEPGLKD
jgi:hypothetical protein